MTVKKQFVEPKRIKNILENYKGDWAIAGGWAIDLFLGFESRKHKDIEIGIPRHEQQLIQTYLHQWECSFVQKRELKQWKKGLNLELPIHEIHVRKDNHFLEILLNEIENGFWTFRRDNRIKLESTNLFHKSSIGIKYLAPEVVLIYKSKFKKPNDLFDLKQTLPKLSKEQILWLKDSNKKIENDWEEWNYEINSVHISQ